MERLYAISYGIVLRSNNHSGFKDLGVYIYNTIFNVDFVVEHILLRDYASNTIEYINKLRIYIKLLEENPYMGVDCKNKHINKKCRIIIFENYNIYYSIEKDYIKILKIINAKQLQKI